MYLRLHSVTRCSYAQFVRVVLRGFVFFHNIQVTLKKFERHSDRTLWRRVQRFVVIRIRVTLVVHDSHDIYAIRLDRQYREIEYKIKTNSRQMNTTVLCFYVYALTRHAALLFGGFFGDTPHVKLRKLTRSRECWTQSHCHIRILIVGGF